MLRRELIRLARRRQTWVLRTGFTGILLGLCVAILASQLERARDPSAFGGIGNQLFNFYSAFTMLGVALIAPIQVASGIQEEKDAKTLDLMTLTGISPSTILQDQISSRLFALMAVIVAGVPFLAALNSFGGFAPQQVVNGAYAALSLAAILGTFAGFASLLTRAGPLLPWILCFPYALAVFGIPTLTAAAWMGDEAVLYANPLLGSAAPTAWALVSAVLWVPALVSGWPLMVAVFEIQAGGDEHDEGFGLLSPKIWVVERFKRTTWMWTIALFGVWAMWFFARLLGLRPDLPLVGMVAGGIAWICVHRVALLLVLLGSEQLETLVRHPIRLGFARTAPRRVWGPPVAWREIATRAAGAARLVPVGLGVVWGLLLALIAVSDGRLSRDTVVGMAALGALGGWVTAALVSTATLLDERRRNTLGLLYLTPLDPARVARQKTWAPVAFAAPLLALAIGLWALRPTAGATVHAHHTHFLGPNLLTHVPVLPELTWAAWMVLNAANVGLIAMIGAAWVANARAAWVVALLGGITWIFGPLGILGVLETLDLHRLSREFEELMTLWYPFMDDTALFCASGGIPVPLAISVAIQWVATPVLWQILAGRLRALGIASD